MLSAAVKTTEGKMNNPEGSLYYQLQGKYTAGIEHLTMNN